MLLAGTEQQLETPPVFITERRTAPTPARRSQTVQLAANTTNSSIDATESEWLICTRMLLHLNTIKTKMSNSCEMMIPAKQSLVKSCHIVTIVT